MYLVVSILGKVPGILSIFMVDVGINHHLQAYFQRVHAFLKGDLPLWRYSVSEQDSHTLC